MAFEFTLNIPGDTKTITLEPGQSVFFVGANGSGKTRLATKIEGILGERCHRISAHRALNLNLSIPKIARVKAENSLFYGNENFENSAQRTQGRWGKKCDTPIK